MIGPFSISNLPAIKDAQGVWRVLGCLPETEESVADFPKFGEAFLGAGPIDPSRWQEIDLEWHKPDILDQKATSACVGFSTCSGMEMCWLQSGRSYSRFNPYFIYGLINGGRDAGAMISDALRALQNYGVCSRDALPSNAMFKNQFPQSAFENARRFKLIKAYKCGTFEEICSAISLGFICPLGILVGGNFPRLDSEGVAPLPNGGGGGHALCGIGLKKSSRYGWVIKVQNSWGNFGMRGYCYIRREHFRSMHPDAFAIQSVSDDPMNPDDVPVVKEL